MAVAIPLLFVATGATTESLKHLLATQRFDEWLGHAQIGAASWPSGHSTAAMTMALCAVIAAPPRLRPTVAAVGGAFAVAVAYAILTLGWHFPSDVFGGYLVAATYVLLAVSAIALQRAPLAEPAWGGGGQPSGGRRPGARRRAGRRGRGRRRGARAPARADGLRRHAHDLRGRRAGDRGARRRAGGRDRVRVPGAGRL